jgi:hypothetical protein
MAVVTIAPAKPLVTGGLAAVAVAVAATATLAATTVLLTRVIAAVE